eukprot:g63110.t1
MIAQASSAHLGTTTEVLTTAVVQALLLPPGMAASTRFGSQVTTAPEKGGSRPSSRILHSKRALISLTCKHIFHQFWRTAVTRAFALGLACDAATGGSKCHRRLQILGK